MNSATAKFCDGDRVRDRRHGCVGTVHELELTVAERESGEYVTAEVRWDGLFVADELELVAPHLELVGGLAHLPSPCQTCEGATP